MTRRRSIRVIDKRHAACRAGLRVGRRFAIVEWNPRSASLRNSSAFCVVVRRIPALSRRATPRSTAGTTTQRLPMPPLAFFTLQLARLTTRWRWIGRSSLSGSSLNRCAACWHASAL